MTTWAEQLNRSSFTWRQGMLWTGAALVMIAAHAGGVAFLLREPPIEMADNAPPPAIMIEMAAEPEAINTEENNIAEQTQDSAEVKSDTTEPVEEPEEMVEKTPPEEIQPEQPVEKVEPEPVEKITPEPEAEPIEQEIVQQLDNVEVPIPVFRPKIEDKKPVEKPEPKKRDLANKLERKKPAPSSKAANEAAAQVRQSNRNAASQTTAGMGFGSVSPAKWQSRLMAHLERRKKYPSGARSRREQGTAYVRFRIDDAGNVLSASLVRSSGFPELDAEVMSLVKRASPVPAPPAGVNKTITAPVRFTVR
ncbi:energy transducer TonB [Brucella pseudogrignonensis]|uniref:TonB family protein n=1 Tax=Brucella pseudogrignonensis TaxID=419475 RepID=UPI001E3548BF|nr:energy transducer TonB [Brucella pseudogrignonensis]MCD4512138.1 energy transducer TonB [Brucella pseudogrignonensis]